ncbi:hypothetical protein GCM10010317_086460 [Streptomyces mirabilis]|nr:hypothetical protein GCM10010317_086460 [Streptomyces mirabilis]
MGELSMVTFQIRESRLVPDTKRECTVRCPTSPEAVAFAMNARVVALCRDLSCDCFRYFTVGVLTTDEGVSEARTPPSLQARSQTARALRHWIDGPSRPRRWEASLAGDAAARTPAK